jgi:hypothetical protein
MDAGTAIIITTAVLSLLLGFYQGWRLGLYQGFVEGSQYRKRTQATCRLERFRPISGPQTLNYCVTSHFSVPSGSFLQLIDRTGTLEFEC